MIFYMFSFYKNTDIRSVITDKRSVMSDIISGKLEIAVLIDSLDAVVASLLALLQLYGTLKRIQKLKEKLPFISKLNYQCFCSRT